MSIITANNICHTYISGNIKNEVITNLDFSIDKSEIVSIMGKSGSGKTTLLKILGGLLKPTQGKVIYNDKDVYSLSESQRCILRRREFGFVFQDYQLINEFNAYENAVYPLLIDKSTPDRHFLKEIFDLLEITDKAKRYPCELSGGEQQRVAIARAIAAHPKLLLCDEPTGNLDEETSCTVINLLRKINETYNTAILLVTHDKDIASFADRTEIIKSHGITINNNP